MDLVADYWDKGYTSYVDNFYISMDLANILCPETPILFALSLVIERGLRTHKNIPSTCNGEQLTSEKGGMNCLDYPNGIVYSRDG